MSKPLTDNEQKVYNYLKMQFDFVSPTTIGHDVGGQVKGYYGWHYRHSSWASPICKRLVERGLIERNEKGWYRAK